jgi:hypothetical protein
VLALNFLAEAGPDGSLLWLLFWVLGFFFLIIVVGWMVSGNKGNNSNVQPEAHEQHQHKDVDEPIQTETKSSKLKSRRRK